MYKFTLSEKFKQRGVSPDAIPPEMRNRFDAFFNENGTSVLDGRLQVRLDETVVRFFFYRDIINTDVLIEDKYQEIASISLNNVKETGYDILYFKENVERKCPKEVGDYKDTIIKIAKNFVGYPKTKGKELRLFNFPFVDSWNFNNSEPIEGWFAFFMECCFLYFLFELENRESDFPNSPIYDNVRDKLRQSDVYQLLCAKVKYTIRIYEGTAALSEVDYSTITLKYADRLMDKNQNRIVPHDYYEEQLWFYDPESELDFIVKRNAKNRKKRGEAKLDNKIYGKLRDYFFTRHSMVSAMGNKWTKIAYWLYLGIICVFSVFATICMLNFDSGSKTVEWFFNHIVWWDCIAAGALGVLVVLWCSTRSFSVFMPRVLVAIGIGWLTTFISEDLIKSQVSIHNPLAVSAWFCVVFLICLLVLGEIRKYSPYYFGNLRQYHKKLLSNQLKNGKDSWKEKLKRLEMWIRSFLYYLLDWKRATHPSSWKLAPILIHSYFWALTLGVVMQLTVYKDLIEHSKVLPEVVYGPTFEKSDSYVMYLNNLKESLISYEDDLLALCGGISGSIGIPKDSNNLSFLKIKPEPDFNRHVGRFQSKKNDVIETYNNVESFRAKVFEDWIQARRKKDSNFVCHDIDLFFSGEHIKDSLEYYIKEIMSQSGISNEVRRNIAVNQLLFLDSTITNIENEKRDILISKSDYKNWDSLITWSEYPDVIHEKYPVDIKECLKQTAICENDLCREVSGLWWFGKRGGGKLHLFPIMLIFHTLIVLIIAFVGNLIVSDKSITEPL